MVRILPPASAVLQSIACRATHPQLVLLIVMLQSFVRALLTVLVKLHDLLLDVSEALPPVTTDVPVFPELFRLHSRASFVSVVACVEVLEDFGERKHISGYRREVEREARWVRRISLRIAEKACEDSECCADMAREHDARKSAR